jgi:glucose-6-phosphate isomerase, archaeal
MIFNEIIRTPEVVVDMVSGIMKGHAVTLQQRRMSDLKGVFADEQARLAMPPDQLAYEVQMYTPVPDGTEGGLFFGNTTIYPTKVGNEFMMTKGHFHAKANRNEYYLGIKGTGYLLFMNENRECWVEPMTQGSLHFIGANLAHRVVNTGRDPLTFLASWPSDAGHNYETIQQHGFSVRIIEKDGNPFIVKV